MRIFILHTFFLLISTIIFNNKISAQINNNCANASIIKSDATCLTGLNMLAGQTLSGATADGYSITSGCSVQSNYQDVWYKFVAKTKTPTITISNLGIGWVSIGNVGIQLLSGSCGSFTEIACTSSTKLTPLLTKPLQQGNTYYIKIHRYTANVPPNCTFDICLTDDYAKVSRMNEIFSRTVLSSPGFIQYPWEITYGPDDSLWVNEARDYKLYKMSPLTGEKRLVLNLSSNSTWFGTSGTGADTLYAQNMATWYANSGGWPQGGFAGFALHPSFGKGSGHDYVYVSYVWKFLNSVNPNGVFYRNKLVRFTFNASTKMLDKPAVLDWNLPGSKDHNSQRLIIAPVTPGGTNYLFMASGDMGAGQFENRYRKNNAQNVASYEGKILRYNLDSVGQPGVGYQKWVPNDNPYGAKSAVWAIGIRNNQGFAYDSITNVLYGSSHGPYSDDEINIIEGFKNYGHPLVIGYAADGNYNGNAASGTYTSISAGSPFTDCNFSGNTPPLAYTSPYCGKSSIAPVGNENINKNTINANAAVSGIYMDPIFSAYPSTQALVTSTWQNNPNNAGWESEAWSGLDIYTNQLIPGWKRSLVVGGLKWGRVIKLNLDETGTKTLPSGIGSQVGNASDTVTYFQSTNRYRDMAFAPNGKDIFLVMDNSSSTSGPGSNNPTAPACPGCVVKYSFLGYADAAGLSTIPKTIAITNGAFNTCNSGTTVTIDGTNNFLWVPITGPDGDILAEINAMGQNMGIVKTSFYKNGSAIRTANGVKYLDRNITINSTSSNFVTPVKVRLYITKAEVDALIAANGVDNVLALKIHTNNDACLPSISNSTTLINTVNTTLPNIAHGPNGYVLQTAVTNLSSFYFAGNATILPLNLLSFSGYLQNNLSALLKWKTQTEVNVAGFDVERSIDGNTYNKIGYVKATGNNLTYTITDNEATDQQSLLLYYRLKIKDNDGSFKYSSTITIKLPITKVIITIAPNPVSNDLKGAIILPITGRVTLHIFDNIGRMVLQTNLLLKKGSNNFVQNINQLGSGFYYIDIVGKGIYARTRFQKL